MYQVLLRSQVRAIENQYKVKNTVSEEQLILRAATKLFDFVKSKTNQCTSILIFAGKGNNGNDGRMLHNLLVIDGYSSTLVDVDNCENIDAVFDGKYDIIVDAIFGIGLNDAISGKYAEIINKINKYNACKIAVDIPSGLDADSGKILGVAVKADSTVTFIAKKAGMLINDGLDCCGEIVVADIGIAVSECSIFHADKQDIVFAKRKRNSHKGDYGKIKIIGGSTQMCGAPLLSAKACLKSGGGLVTLAVPKSLHRLFALKVVEATLYLLSDNDGNVIFDQNEIDSLVDGADVVVVGMGLGKNSDIIKIIQHLLTKNIKLIIDADGLNALSGNIKLLLDKRAAVTLTPHIAEFSRLCSVPIGELSNNPIKYATEFAKKYGVVVNLKGCGSIVTDGNRAHISTIGSPALAKGGSGDVLAGINGALACVYPPLEAALYAAAVLGTAGETAAAQLGENSVLASDVVERISF